MGVIFGKKRRTERGQSNEESEKKTSTHVHTPVGTGYRMTPGTASTAQHGTAPQGKARHRTAPHGAALLNYSWAELSCQSIIFVIQHIVPGT